MGEMISPCKCSGTQRMVHTSCLNHWRATSADAYFLCSICKYEYKVRQAWLMSILMYPMLMETMSIIVIIVIIYSVGIISRFISARIPILQVENRIFQLLDIEIPTAAFCADRTISLKRILKRLRKAHGLWGYVPSMTLLQLVVVNQFFCHSLISAVFVTFLVGACITGTIGFLFYHMSMINQWRELGGGYFFLQTGLLGTWVAAIGSISLTRVSLSVGCLMVYFALYNYLMEKLRLLGEFLGDHIVSYQPSAK